MLPQEIIRRKRDGEVLSREEIGAFIGAIEPGAVTEGQIAAFAMAVFLRGMEPGETVALTEAMRDSGDVLDWSQLDRPVVDKHSTGGVGDNVSLILAPILAACGAAVPMISGRGLGHTGGTLDKMEAIPGYRVTPENALLRRVVAETGCAIIGQTGRLAPADGRIYAVRDVTATVESIPLITASILSKKLAAGLQGLVLDVKSGSGAFMAQQSDARALAESLVTVANGAGLKTTALLTGMDEPLARDAGNAVEVHNAVRFLKGESRDPRLQEVTLALASEMLVLGGLASDRGMADGQARAVLAGGLALDRFSRMVAGLGGPIDFVEKMDAYLPKAPVVRPVRAERDGFVSKVDTRALGLVVVALGGGRTRPQDKVDPAVGLTEIRSLGSPVQPGEPLCFVHARSEGAAEEAVQRAAAAITIGEERVPSPAVIERFG